MKRRMKCGTCNTRINSATGKPLYMLSDNLVTLTTASTTTECWDCGEKRREADEAKKQTRLSRLMANDAE